MDAARAASNSWPRFRPWLLRVWRLGAIAAAVVLLYGSHQRRAPSDLAEGLPLELASSFFPEATQLDRPDGHGLQVVRDSDGRVLGSVLTTSPETDDLVGYSGPNNLLVGLDANGKVAGLRLLWSRDTQTHVATVQATPQFWSNYLGWRPASEPPPTPASVSGSTLTSLAIAEGLQRRLTGASVSLRFPEPVTLDEVKSLFPAATTFSPRPGWEGWNEVRDDRRVLLGFAVRTAPHSDNTRGYGGPTESLLAIDPDGTTIRALQLRRSYDTPDYVDRVREDTDYLRQLCGFTVSNWANLDFKDEGLEGVSGATQTSFGIAEGIRRRFAADQTRLRHGTPGLSQIWKMRDWALTALIVIAVALSNSPWRGLLRVRRAWQLVLILAFGLWLGDLLSIALFVGWAQHGPAWRIAPSLVLLGIVALAMPWATRRQVYCHHLCPHGAVQEWLGRLPLRRTPLPAAAHRRLALLPGVLLAIVFLMVLAGWQGNLASLEPFDAWAWRAGAILSALVAAVGLVASAFVPMAYCHYGCPTGALLRYVRTTGTADRFGPRDWAALGLLLAGTIWSLLPNPPTFSAADRSADSPTLVRIGGTGFGTAWNVTVRGKVPDRAHWRQRLQSEIDRIENLLSHWRPESTTSHFNAATTSHPLKVPAELIDLVTRASTVSRATDGAFDLTLAPLAEVLGFGPHASPDRVPTEEDLGRAKARTGWTRLTADPIAGTLRKTHPELQLDLGALLQGYAADRLTEMLRAGGLRECLVEVGGELCASGAWEVAIEDPVDPGTPLFHFAMTNQALSTSGIYRGSVRGPDGIQRRHIFDPRTGLPVTHDTLMAAVVAQHAVDADAWSTALLVLGDDQALATAEQNGVTALLVRRPRDQASPLK